MEFDKSKVYTALNADESLIGAKGYFADDIVDLRNSFNHPNSYGQYFVSKIDDNYIVSNKNNKWSFFYLVELAHEKWYVTDKFKELGATIYNSKTGYYYNEFGQPVAHDCVMRELKNENWYVIYDNEDNYMSVNNTNGMHPVWKILDKTFKTQEEAEQYISEHSKPKYRPFKDCDELIGTYNLKFHHIYNPVELLKELPSIWVKAKSDGRKDLITSFNNEEGAVNIDGIQNDFNELLKYYTFLDGSVCGVEDDK